MNRAFTLVEILVAVTIIAFVSGGVLLNLNKYSSRQRLIKSVEIVNSSLKLAQNYAKTRQLPVGSSETDLRYVHVYMDGNYLLADANDAGFEYYYTEINNSEIHIGSTPADIYFWAGSGRLAKDFNGTAYAVNEKATFYINAQSDITNYGKIEIDSMGQVNLIGIF
jgi:prepilin-type N-terminal cleavage/methylation domain-containing protein